MSNRLAATLQLDAPVSTVPGVADARVAALSRFGVHDIQSLLSNYPRRYLDMSTLAQIATAQIGTNVTIVATVHKVVLKRPRPKLSLVEVTLVDQTGTLIATFFRQPWLVNNLKSGMKVSVAGTIEFNYGYMRMTQPFMEVLEEGDVGHARVIPVHPAGEKISAAVMRGIISQALRNIDHVNDPLPLSLRAKYRLMSRDNALRCIHFPHSMDEQRSARRRLVYEEVFSLECKLLLLNLDADEGVAAHQHRINGPLLNKFKAALPFTLTNDQQAALDEILQRMASPSRMRHMLLGDVGTGKTMVAAAALCAAADSGKQALMMGPTEVLAQQYAGSLGPLFDTAGVSWALLTGSTEPTLRESILLGLVDGSIQVCFGTHALLTEDVVCKNCSFVVVDEEQRFGVEQRAALVAKGEGCDVLEMTATPIPRTLALALYGSTTLSYLREVPFDRPPRTTKVFGFHERGKAYDAALDACARGEQVYIVCPLVSSKKAAEKQQGIAKQNDSADDSTASGFDLEDINFIDDDEDFAGADVKAAENQAAFLQAKTFSAYKVGLLHGRMKPQAKREVMRKFRDGEIDVLVSTTVIEVGVDVPNATVLIVEDAYRFGLSQLHQLRGRVGRATKSGYVYLISATSNPQANERLRAMEKTEDGFELAEYDLSLRREGDILGRRQHGASALKLVNVVRDGAVIEAAHADAAEYVKIHGTGDDAESLAWFREVDKIFGDKID